MYDIDPVQKHFPGWEISEAVATFPIHIPRAPRDLCVVVTTAGSGFLGACNYSVWGPDQASPYKALHTQPSVKEALDDALTGIKAYHEDFVKHPSVSFWVRRAIHSDNDIYIDGCGETVNQEEVNRRRAAHRS